MTRKVDVVLESQYDQNPRESVGKIELFRLDKIAVARIDDDAVAEDAKQRDDPFFKYAPIFLFEVAGFPLKQCQNSDLCGGVDRFGKGAVHSKQVDIER